MLYFKFPNTTILKMHMICGTKQNINYLFNMVQAIIYVFSSKQIIFLSLIINIPSVIGADLSNSVLKDDISLTEPQLIKEGKFYYPLQLLKRGIEGTIKVSLDITKTGVVSDFKIIEGLYPLLDSLIYSSLFSYQFTPALENGRPVEATVLLEIDFDIDNIIHSFASRKPDIEGYILDSISRNPIVGAEVHLACIEPIKDKTLKIPVKKYMEIIGKIPDQYYSNGKIVTETDSNGYFSFSLLPESQVIIEVIAPGFKNAFFSELHNDSVRTNVTYLIGSNNCFPAEINTDSIFEVKVYGTVKSRETIDIHHKERVIGLTHYVSKIVLSHVSVRQIPESGSSMLVRSAGPFDNRYLVSGIPMLAPSHFAGHPYADIDGLMITALKKINIITDRLAGKHSDVNGVVIQADPGVYRCKLDHLKQRPELSVDYSNVGQNFLLSFPFKNKREDFVQVAYTRSEPFTLKWFKFQHFETYRPDLGPGYPLSYGDITATGVFHKKNCKITPFFWLAYDRYDKPDSPILPWGMGSIRLSDTKNKNITSTIGGSRQYYVQGKGYGIINETFTQLTNGYLEFHKNQLLRRVIDLDIGCSVSGMKWTGQQRQKTYDDDSIITLLERSDHELGIEAKGCIYKEIDNLALGFDFLGKIEIYTNSHNVFADAGLYATWKNERFNFGIYSGRVTSHPDIRGLPGEVFRRKLLNTFLFSSHADYFCDTILNISIEPYLRIQPVCPRTNPYTCTWESTKSTKLLACGLDISGNNKLLKWLNLTWAFNAAHSYRDSLGVKLPYEWEIPWTIRGGISIYAGKHITIILDGIISSGLPYFDLGNGGKLSRIPVHYKRINFGFDYRIGKIIHRYLTRFDVYFRAENILDFDNVRDYYWNSNFEQNPIMLKPLMIQIGARFGFRL